MIRRKTVGHSSFSSANWPKKTTGGGGSGGGGGDGGGIENEREAEGAPPPPALKRLSSSGGSGSHSSSRYLSCLSSETGNEVGGSRKVFSAMGENAKAASSVTTHNDPYSSVESWY